MLFFDFFSSFFLIFDIITIFFLRSDKDSVCNSRIHGSSTTPFRPEKQKKLHFLRSDNYESDLKNFEKKHAADVRLQK